MIFQISYNKPAYNVYYCVYIFYLVTAMASDEEQEQFLDACIDGDLELVTSFLAKDPSLIGSRDPEFGM